MSQRHVVASILAFALVTMGAHAATAAEYTAYSDNAATTGNQNYTGSLGMDFDVATAINVYALGVYDSGQDGLAVPITARIYDRNNNAAPLVTIVFAAGNTGTLIGGDRFLPLPCPLTLPAGFQGTIEADGYTDAELNGNKGGGGAPAATSDNGGGLITFNGGGRYGSAGAYPTNIDSGPFNRYSAGTFTYAPACVMDVDCSNPDHPKCGGGGLCGKGSGTFFPACSGGADACETTVGACIACNGDKGVAASHACAGPQLPACMGGACFECNATTTCKTAAKAVCSPSNACTTCNADHGSGISAEAGVDGGALNECPTVGNPFCMSDGTCAKCTTGADCATRAGKPYCAPDGSCSAKCNADVDCGVATSGKVCDDATKLCVAGCRGMNGNGCGPEEVCSSMDGTQGSCIPDAAIDAGAGSDAGTSSTDAGTGGGAGSSGGSSHDASDPVNTDAGSSGNGSTGGSGGCNVLATDTTSGGSLVTVLVGAALAFSAARRRNKK